MRYADVVAMSSCSSAWERRVARGFRPKPTEKCPLSSLPPSIYREDQVNLHISGLAVAPPGLSGFVKSDAVSSATRLHSSRVSAIRFLGRHLERHESERPKSRDQQHHHRIESLRRSRRMEISIRSQRDEHQLFRSRRPEMASTLGWR